MTITVQAPTAPAPQVFTASDDEASRILKALAARQLPSDELRRNAGFEGDLGFSGRMVDLRNRGLVERWQTRQGAPRSTWYGPGWQITQDGRKWLAAHLLAAAPAAEIPHLREEPPARPVAVCDPEPVVDPAIKVLKAIAACERGALDQDVARVVYSTNEREAAYAQLRVRGLIRLLPLPISPRVWAITDAGRAKLGALEPCRALMIRPPMTLMVLPSSAAA